MPDKTPVPPKKLATVPVLEANKVQTRMQELLEMAKHIVLVNHPEEEVNMDYLVKENLKINPSEFPVLSQLIRDVKKDDSVNSNLEVLPHDSTLEMINSTNIDRLPMVNIEPDNQDQSDDEDMSKTLEKTKNDEMGEKSLQDRLDETQNDESSPLNKRKKVVVTSSPNSPIIRTKKPERASFGAKSPAKTPLGKQLKSTVVEIYMICYF